MVTSQFVMLISCALRTRIEDGTGIQLLDPGKDVQYKSL